MDDGRRGDNGFEGHVAVEDVEVVEIFKIVIRRRIGHFWAFLSNFGLQKF